MILYQSKWANWRLKKQPTWLGKELLKIRIYITKKYYIARKFEENFLFLET